MVDRISVESTVKASPARVWDALADPAARAQWWPGMTFEPVSGGSLREQWSEAGLDYVAHGTVREVEPEQLLRFTWSDASWEAPTTVTVTLQPALSATLVRITEQGLAQLSQGSEVAREHEAGWRWHLDRLREHVEFH